MTLDPLDYHGHLAILAHLATSQENATGIAALREIAHLRGFGPQSPRDPNALALYTALLARIENLEKNLGLTPPQP